MSVPRVKFSTDRNFTEICVDPPKNRRIRCSYLHTNYPTFQRDIADDAVSRHASSKSLGAALSKLEALFTGWAWSSPDLTKTDR